MRLVARRDLERRRLDLDEALPLEPAAERRHDPARAPAGTAGGRRGGRRPEGRGSGIGSGKVAISGHGKSLAVGGKIANGARRIRRRPSGRRHADSPEDRALLESHRQPAPQGQRPRDRRPALRRALGREFPSRQGHADHPDRHAPHLRRRQDVAALQDHRAGRARLRRGPRLPVPLSRTATASCS